MRVDGFKLACLIADKGESVQLAAVNAGIHPETLYHMLKGKSCRIDNVGAIAKHLGVKTEDIAIKE